jgi:hypothetical protein
MIGDIIQEETKGKGTLDVLNVKEETQGDIIFDSFQNGL